MNKSQTILAAIGGATGVVSAVLGYFIWDAFSGRGERIEALEDAMRSAERLAGQPVYPGPAGESAYQSNRAAYVEWRGAAFELAASGDTLVEKTTPPAFKEFLVREARRLSSLPGGVEGKIVKSDFAFGFNDYITGGVIPARDDLERLQREWGDVTEVVEILAKAQVVEITSIAVKAPPPPPEPPKPAGGFRRSAKRDAAKDAAADAKKPLVTHLAVEFTTRPSGLVNAINAFAAAGRFVVVDEMGFARESDTIAEALGVDDKKEREQAAGGRRRRRSFQSEEPAKEEAAAAKSGLVTDPATCAPLKVSMSLSVYDFRSLERTDGEGSKTEGAR